MKRSVLMPAFVLKRPAISSDFPYIGDESITRPPAS
jgi:hypothetical protein